MWFEDLFGFTEHSPAQVLENLSLEGTLLTSRANNQSFDCGTLEIPTLNDLRISAAEIASKSTERTTLTQIVGNVQNFHAAPESRRAMFQVASQFNLLEMAAPDAIPEDGVGIYEHDYTQGPACAIAAGAGTVYRNYLVPLKNQTGQSADCQVDCLANIGKALGNESQQLWQMQNGYAFASRDGLSIITEQLAKLDAKSIKDLAFQLKSEHAPFVGVFASRNNGKAGIAVAISDDVISEKGLKAGEMVKELASYIHGGGGGQPMFAAAGGTYPEGIKEALSKAGGLI